MIKPRSNDINVEAEMTSGGRRIVVLTRENKYIYMQIEGDKLIRLEADEPGAVKPGDIYVARVANINKSLEGAFVYIKHGVQAYIDSASPEGIFLLNREYDGRLKQGDELFVSIKKAAYANKTALCVPLKEIECDFYNKGLIYKAPATFKSAESVLKDMIGSLPSDELNDFSVICDCDKSFKAVSEILEGTGISIREHKESKVSLNVVYGLKAKLDRVTEDKVWLKCGGYLFIEKTNAMTVIDVNSGKIREKSREAGFLVTSLQAADEIAYQIGARNLSGIIMVDMLKINNEKDKTMLINLFKEKLSALNPPARLVDITKLGLFEITRQKIRPDISEILKHIDKTKLL